ncbi:MAG: YunC family protein [Candidatus Omnitrophota bacterium]
MIAKTIRIKLNNQTIYGYTIKLPNANLVLATAKKGFVCCGYLNLETAQKLGDAACVVHGVKTVADLLKAKVVGLTPKAMALGVKLGMRGQEALSLML